MRRAAFALAVALIGATATLATANSDTEADVTSASPSTSEPPLQQPVCDRRCTIKREYGKLRRSTDRNPTTSCIVEHESHGNLHAQNTSGSGAGGRYQIMPGTWEANLPSKHFIGIAQSVEYHFHKLGHDEGPQWSERLLQDKVAANIVSSSGLAPWTQYDGC